MTNRARVFVGSARESLPIVDAIHKNLEREAIVTPWKHGFRPSEQTMAELERNLGTSDFGVFVLTPDDVVKMRDETLSVPRDNVVYELGMFVGRLGVSRCLFLVPRGTDKVHLPSDLSGVKPIEYDAARDDDDLVSATNVACADIVSRIKELGFAEHRQPRELCELISAYGTANLLGKKAERRAFKRSLFERMISVVRSAPVNKAALSSGDEAQKVAFAAAVIAAPEKDDVRRILNTRALSLIGCSVQHCFIRAISSLVKETEISADHVDALDHWMATLPYKERPTIAEIDLVRKHLRKV
jgi:hypothetical protein